MAYDTLVGPTNAFIAAVTPLVRGLAGDLRDHARAVPSAVSGEAWSETVVNEVSNLIAAMVDADGVHTDAELLSLTRAMGPHLGTGVVGAAPDDLRRGGLVAGRRSWLDRPSELFGLLVDADRTHGGRRAWTYYRHALDLAHAVAAVDVHTSQGELDGIARLRSTLIRRIESAGVPRPAPAFFTGPLGEAPAPDRVPVDPAAPLPPGVDPTAAATDTSGPTAAMGGTEAEPARPPAPEPRAVEEVLAELDALVGLEPVKAEVKLVADLLTVQKLREDRGLPVVSSSRHLVFTGNPGTGKTTVARLLAEIYASLGVVERGHLVETDRSGLVAGFVGQTAARTKEVCDSALDGMLLVDEAYALARGKEGDFGQEAIDTLVKFIEDERDRVVVVVAGYPDEMATFVNANPGLSSRFPKTIHFPDYTPEQLVAIFEIISGKNHYELSDDAREALQLHFEAAERGRGFGNGRAARNLFEAAIARQASRLVAERGAAAEAARQDGTDEPETTDEQLVTLTPHDVLGPEE